MKMKIILFFTLIFSLSLSSSSVFAQRPTTVQKAPPQPQASSSQAIVISPEDIKEAEGMSPQSTNTVDPQPIKINFPTPVKESLPEGAVVPPALTATSKSSPTVVALPAATSVVISPALERPISINARPVEFNETKIAPALSFEIQTAASSISSTETPKVNVNLTVDQNKNETKIEAGGVAATTQETLKVEESTLNIETSGGSVPVSVLPSIASSTVISAEPQQIKDMTLSIINHQAIYEVKGVKKSSIFLLIPVSVPLVTQVSANSGKILEIKKPWWSFLAL